MNGGHWRVWDQGVYDLTYFRRVPLAAVGCLKDSSRETSQEATVSIQRRQLQPFGSG